MNDEEYKEYMRQKNEKLAKDKEKCDGETE